jgi:hypothetical protein
MSASTVDRRLRTAKARAPAQRLPSKTRGGSKAIKRHEPVPQAPAQRPLASPLVPEAEKERVRRMLAGHDYLSLRDEIQSGLRLLAKKLSGGSPPPGQK